MVTVRWLGVLVISLLVIGCTLAAKPGDAQAGGSTPVSGKAYTVPELGLKMVWIPPGEFVMGSPRDEEGHEYSEAQHPVKITQGYWMGAYEVTVGEWKVFAEDSGYLTAAERNGGMFVFRDAMWRFDHRFTWKNPNYEQSDRHPVVGVNWFDVKAFGRWLTRREKSAGRLPDGWEYTLPTEAQWEYATRAGFKGRYIGHSIDRKKDIWYKFGKGDGIPTTPKKSHPVGLKPVNAWGLYDVHGNVWEWIEDWYAEDITHMNIDPTGPKTGTRRVCRGGSWNSEGKNVRAAMRGYDAPNDRANNVGFRLSLRAVGR